ncbi:hypothetical protein GCM10027348_03520 [Hymenobacter tenuis]
MLPGGSPFASLEEASLEVAYYFDTYCNLDRRHSALVYRSPHQFEGDIQISLSHFLFLLDHISNHSQKFELSSEASDIILLGAALHFKLSLT